MKKTSFLPKIVSIIGFVIMLFNINCSVLFKHNEVPVKQKFVVSALDSIGMHKITLTIIIDANNNAKVVREVAKASPKDVHKVFIVGDSLHSTGSSTDTAEIEITASRAGSQRFWLDFNQTAPKMVNDGGDIFKFFCNSENCVKNVSSLPLLTSTGYLTSFSCTQSCQVCVLNHFIIPGLIIEGSGVYIYANSVRY
jgi:hypothetical protein